MRWERGTKDDGQLFTIFLKILKINTKIQIDSMFSLVVVGGWEIHPIQFCLVVAILPGRDDRSLDWVYPNLLLPLMTSFMTTMKRGRGIPHSHQTIVTPRSPQKTRNCLRISSGVLQQVQTPSSPNIPHHLTHHCYSRIPNRRFTHIRQPNSFHLGHLLAPT